MKQPAQKMASGTDEKAVSRRSFLTRAGAAAGGVMLETSLIASDAWASNEPEQKFIGPAAVPFTLRVNGAARTVNFSPNTTLAEVLRGTLDLTGTKIGRDRGACSACTVWLDGLPVASCMTLAIDVGERSVTTIEGLSDGDRLHPVHSAFIEHDAVQCGFCTSGMVMSCAALLARNPHPTLDDVKAATGGHLDRKSTR